ncbi:MAG TPA: hypothetical protein VLV46_01465 [Gaiellaceae bacterium]|nr:hypothetical protein [Gaiellaceae bacterium]
MRIHTSLMTAAVALVLAVPGVAVAATASHHYVPTIVQTTVDPGTTAVSAGCTMTIVAGHVSSFRCPGYSVHQASQGLCTLNVAAGTLWTYTCPSDTGGPAIQGASRGVIPAGCTPFVDVGFRWLFSCPRKAFTGVGSVTHTAATAKAAAGPATRRCAPPLTDHYLDGELCLL